MDNEKISHEKTVSQPPEKGLNLVGPTIVYLDSDFLRINAKFAKDFERLNSGALL